jgi:hypothetical protein
MFKLRPKARKVVTTTQQVDIRKLPVELWQQIFDECGVRLTLQILSSLTWPFSTPTRTPSTRVLLSISQVCHYFRQIVLAMPLWWSAIDLTRPLSEIETFLERSTPLPIVITEVYLSSFRSSQHEDIFRSIQDRIVAIDTPVQPPDLKSLRHCRNLRHLMIESSLSRYRGEGFFPLLDNFKSLRSLWWMFPDTVRANDLLVSPQSRYSLTSLHISGYLPDTSVLPLLRCCPSLENISLSVVGSQSTESEQVVHLPRLRNLRVEFMEEDGWFGKIQLPHILECYQFDYCYLYPRHGYQKWGMWMESVIIGSHPDPAFVLSWLAGEPGVLKHLGVKPDSIKSQETCLNYLSMLQTKGSSPISFSRLEEVKIEQNPFSHSILSFCYTLGAYLDLFSGIRSHRKEAGLPSLLFTWNGRRLKLNEDLVPQPTEMICNEDSESISRPRRIKVALKRLINVSAVIKCPGWLRSRVKQ